MKTRRSPKNQDRLHRAISNDLSQACKPMPHHDSDDATCPLCGAWNQLQHDMLRACKAARVELSAMHRRFYPMCDGGCPADAILRQLAIVIAKSEGRS